MARLGRELRWTPGWNNYMMDKATIGQEVEYPGVTRLDNYMMDKVCELNPMLTKSHTPP